MQKWAIEVVQGQVEPLKARIKRIPIMKGAEITSHPAVDAEGQQRYRALIGDGPSHADLPLINVVVDISSLDSNESWDIILSTIAGAAGSVAVPYQP